MDSYIRKDININKLSLQFHAVYLASASKTKTIHKELHYNAYKSSYYSKKTKVKTCNCRKPSFAFIFSVFLIKITKYFCFGYKK